MDKKLGSYAFLLVLALAVIAGLFPQLQAGQALTTVTWILVILGLIVGLLNVTKRESEGFLVASVALLIVTAALPAVLQIVF